MFGKSKFNKDDVSIIHLYSPDLYEDIQEFLKNESIGLGDIDLNLPKEKFEETIQHLNFKYFLIIKYQEQIIVFSLGILPNNEKENEIIESMLAIHKKFINVDCFEIIHNAISNEIKKNNQNKIKIRWWMPPIRMGKCNRYFKKLGYTIIEPWELIKEL